jgi:imidazoleglycerol phosphate dehydratase HisB
MTSKSRTATISRNTSETSVEVSLDLDCAPGSNVKQNIEVSTGIGFLDHVRVLDLIMKLPRSVNLELD